MSNCPFKNAPCGSDCALFIREDELNELVVNHDAAHHWHHDRLHQQQRHLVAQLLRNR